MLIVSNFDSGAIVVDSVERHKATLKIRPDAEHAGSPYSQWFHFRAVNLVVDGTTSSSFVINNAKDTTYPGGWENYNVCASYDRETWFRIKSTYNENEEGYLCFSFIPKYTSCFFAYFPPYSYERQLSFNSKCQLSSLCTLGTLDGLTVDGTVMDVLCIGKDSISVKKKLTDSTYKLPVEKMTLWIVCRQHPGETQASWWCEGFVNRLLDINCAKAKEILNQTNVYVIPNMNPDGSRRGYLRVNAKGKNLNREWDCATIEDSPEVYYTKQAIKRTGIDFFLDCHSEEELEYVFISKTCLGIPSHTKRQQQLYDTYCQALKMANPEFQTEVGYKMPEPGGSNMGISVAYMAETYNILAVTQEQPFKDNVLYPQEGTEWSPKRCEKLGESAVDAIFAILPHLKK